MGAARLLLKPVAPSESCLTGESGRLGGVEDMRAAGLVILLILVAVALTLLVARVRWRSVTNDLIAQLSASSMETVSAAILPAEIDSLPAPVARYLGAVLGPSPIASAGTRGAMGGALPLLRRPSDPEIRGRLR